MKLNWSTMPVGPAELQTNLVGDNEAFEAFAAAMLEARKKGLVQIVTQSPNGALRIVINCLDPKEEIGS